MRERLYGHTNDIRAKNEVKPVSRHFSALNHTIDDVDVTILMTTQRDNNIRLRTEETLIDKFNTKSPNGLNLL